MTEFAAVKLAIDLALVASLLFLCYRFGRSNTSALSARISGLESSLRLLVEDADNAGRALNDKLLKRKGDLEKLLFDLETSEQRLNRSLGSAESAKVELEQDLAKFQSSRQIQAASQAASQAANQTTNQTPNKVSAPASATVNSEMTVASSEDLTTSAELSEENPAASAEVAAPIFNEPPSFSQPAPSLQQYSPRDLTRSPSKLRLGVEKISTRAQASSSAPTPAIPSAKPDQVRYNIYGDEIPPEATSPAAAAPRAAQVAKAAKAKTGETPLALSIEKQRHNSYQEPLATNEKIQDVYDAAENLLRAGQSLQAVATQTQLPVDEVQILSQMMQQEQIARQTSNVVAEDTRLGVLSSITRRTQVL